MLRKILTFTVLAIAIPMSAQERCRETDTPRQCFERWVAAPVTIPDAPPPASETSVKTLIASVNDGVSDLNAPVQASLKNFLSALSASLDTAVTGDDTTGVAFGYTPPIDLRGLVRIEAKFTKPQLSAETIGKVTDAAERTKLEASLTALDDVKWALSYDWTSRLAGRSVERHRPLLAALVPPPADPQAAFVQALAATGIAPANAELSLRQLNVGAGVFENMVRLGAGAPAQLETDFASLLNNQPQVYVTAFYTARRDVVGPEERGASLTLELSGRNLNGFYRAEGRDCGTNCAQVFQAYLARVRDPRFAPRIAVTAGYARTDATPHPVRSFIYSLSAGIPFPSLVSGKDGRLEAGISYDGKTRKGTLYHVGPNLTADAKIISPPILRETIASPAYERGAASIAYTQSLSDRVSVPIFFVYREVEYAVLFQQELSVVRERESAVHVSLRYRLVPPRPAPRCCC